MMSSAATSSSSSSRKKQNGSKRKKDNGLTDGSDVFHNYMHRKIELQRKQFGLILPPTSTPDDYHEDENGEHDKCSVTKSHSSPCKKSSALTVNDGDVVGGIGDKNSSSCSSMAALMERLKRRHDDDHSSKKRRGRKRSRRKVLILEDNNMKNTVTEDDDAGKDNTPKEKKSNDTNHHTPKPNSKRNHPNNLIFSSIVVLINGHTTPDATTLQRTLHKYGGDVEKYETKRVTHIIAEQLSTAKATFYKKRRTKVVHPDWIVKSVDCGKLLWFGDFLLDCVKEDGFGGKKGCKKNLTSFFGAAKGGNGGDDSGEQMEKKQDVEQQHLAKSPLLKKNKRNYDDDDDAKNIIIEVENESSTPSSPTTSLPPPSSSFGNDFGGFMTQSPTTALANITKQHEHQITMEKEKSNNPIQNITSATKSDFVNDGGCTVINNNEKDVVTGKSSLDVDALPSSLSLCKTRHFTNQKSPMTMMNEINTYTEDKEEDKNKKSISESMDNLDESTCSATTSSSVKVSASSKLHSVTINTASTTTLSSTITTKHSTTNNSTTQKNHTSSLFSSTGMRTTGTDPNFLSSYFEHSRLSFIGSFQQRIKKSCGSGNNTTAATTGNKHPKHQQQKERFVFHIDMDCFFASVVLRKYPQFVDKPVAVGHCWKTSNSNDHRNDCNINGMVGDNTNEYSSSNINQFESQTSSSSSSSLAPRGKQFGEKTHNNHNNNTKRKSYSELSTCNYVARKFGVKKGMFLHQAKVLCPDLIVLPYDYEGYEEVSSQVADILHHCAEDHDGSVEQVSCDEAYMELYLDSGSYIEKPENRDFVDAQSIAENIRSEILSKTRCTASVGVGPNKLLAKIATDKIKPNGMLVVETDGDAVEKLLGEMKLRDIPGIGYRLERKLISHGFVFVRDVLDLGLGAEKELCSILGPGNGKKILQFCRGKDDRPVQKATRKTIGAECNYGVRFDGPYGVNHMIVGLAKEVEKRMECVGVTGKKITLKVMQRKEGATEPVKFLGHGPCYHLSRSCDLPMPSPTRDPGVISKIGMKLFNELGVNKDEVRGMGIVVSKLHSDTDGEVSGVNKMSGWLKQTASNNCTSAGTESLWDRKASSVGKSNKSDNRGQKHGEYATCLNESVVDKMDRHLSKQRSVRFSLDVGYEASLCSPPLHMSDDIEYEDSFGPSQHRLAVNGDVTPDILVPTASQIDEEVLCFLPESLQRVVSRKLEMDKSVSLPSKSACQRSKTINISQLPIKNTGEKLVTSTFRPAGEESSILLPSPSQIDREQVMALPETLREEVLKMIDEKTKSTLSSSEIDYSRAPPPKEVKPAPPRRKRNVAFPRKRQKSCEGDESERFKQVSMRQMLKLATIKSGQESLKGSVEGDSILLAELEYLPLEMQLQVANHEMCIGTSIPPEHMPSKSEGVTECKDGHNKQHTPTSSSNKSLDTKDKESCTPDVCWVGLTADEFYKENVAPLLEWIRTHPDPTLNDISKVQDFFSVCISEKRAEDVVKLLRVIKNMPDGWSADTYARVISFVENQFASCEGFVLDSLWLGLR